MLSRISQLQYNHSTSQICVRCKIVWKLWLIINQAAALAGKFNFVTLGGLSLSQLVIVTLKSPDLIPESRAHTVASDLCAMHANIVITTKI